jgi:2-polyprenyl-3-methyl-5-hydroxy-6-metoxy-1,4-benzoquinol methylase
MTQYRDTLYANYHTTQSGRASLTDAKALFNRETWRFKKEILPLVSHRDKKQAILDLGCGSGSLINALTSFGFEHVEGIDLSSEQIHWAHAMGVHSAREGNILEILKDPNTPSYDVITGMDIIEHFTKNELVALIGTIKSKLKPGGMVIFRTPNLDAPIATAYANGDFTHENYMNASSAQQLLMACGFKSVTVKESNMEIPVLLKEIIRKVLWLGLKTKLKATLFASGRSTQNVIFSPNMILIAQNHEA